MTISYVLFSLQNQSQKMISLASQMLTTERLLLGVLFKQLLNKLSK